MLNKKILILLVILLLPINIFAYQKEEFIYTNIDSKGKEIDKLVNNEIKIKSKGTIEDETYLKNILNINGDEKFDLNNNNKLLWKSDGKSILYQGEIDKDSNSDLLETFRCYVECMGNINIVADKLFGA